MPRARKKVVLIVDQSTDIRDLLKIALEEMYVVESTGLLAQAAADARNSKHALFIVNVERNIGTDEGLQFIGALRADQDERPVIAISGRKEADLATKCYAAGADVFVPKTSQLFEEVHGV